MSSRLTWTGLAEFRRELEQSPDTLAREAEPIVQQHAAEAALAVQAGYPVGPTGNLRAGVRREAGRRTSRYGRSAVVISGAPHAHLFEGGTRARRTRQGAFRGRMPAADPSQQMIPKVVAARRRMLRALMEQLTRLGFEVQT